MKRLFGLLFTLMYFLGFSQTEKLFYYTENDSLIGVKNDKGKIIVPAVHCIMPHLVENKREIKEDVFMFWTWNEGPKAYNRKGDFLFAPYIFDNGYDYLEEGCMRFTENKKMGLVNRKGEKIIPAKYGWISSPHFGIIEYCNGCYWDTAKDEEHPPLVGGTWGFLDKKGNEIFTTDKKSNPKDFETKEHKFIPYQFKYNKKELDILAFFEKRKEEIIQINHLDCTKDQLQFEIVENPRVSEPYYLIRSFIFYDNYERGSDYQYDDFQNFKISKDGKKFYVLYRDLVDYGKYSDYVERKIIVDDWIKESMKNIKKNKN